MDAEPGHSKLDAAARPLQVNDKDSDAAPTAGCSDIKKGTGFFMPLSMRTGSASGHTGGDRSTSPRRSAPHRRRNISTGSLAASAGHDNPRRSSSSSNLGARSGRNSRHHLSVAITEDDEFADYAPMADVHAANAAANLAASAFSATAYDEHAASVTAVLMTSSGLPSSVRSLPQQMGMAQHHSLPSTPPGLSPSCQNLQQQQPPPPPPPPPPPMPSLARQPCQDGVAVSPRSSTGTGQEPCAGAAAVNCSHSGTVGSSVSVNSSYSGLTKLLLQPPPPSKLGPQHAAGGASPRSAAATAGGGGIGAVAGCSSSSSSGISSSSAIRPEVLQTFFGPSALPAIPPATSAADGTDGLLSFKNTSDIRSSLLQPRCNSGSSSSSPALPELSGLQAELSGLQAELAGLLPGNMGLLTSTSSGPQASKAASSPLAATSPSQCAFAAAAAAAGSTEPLPSNIYSQPSFNKWTVLPLGDMQQANNNSNALAEREEEIQQRIDELVLMKQLLQLKQQHKQQQQMLQQQHKQQQQALEQQLLQMQQRSSIDAACKAGLPKQQLMQQVLANLDNQRTNSFTLQMQHSSNGSGSASSNTGSISQAALQELLLPAQHVQRSGGSATGRDFQHMQQQLLVERSSNSDTGHVFLQLRQQLLQQQQQQQQQQVQRSAGSEANMDLPSLQQLQQELLLLQQKQEQQEQQVQRSDYSSTGQAFQQLQQELLQQLMPAQRNEGRAAIAGSNGGVLLSSSMSTPVPLGDGSSSRLSHHGLSGTNLSALSNGSAISANSYGMSPPPANSFLAVANSQMGNELNGFGRLMGLSSSNGMVAGGGGGGGGGGTTGLTSWGSGSNLMGFNLSSSASCMPGFDLFPDGVSGAQEGVAVSRSSTWMDV